MLKLDLFCSPRDDNDCKMSFPTQTLQCILGNHFAFQRLHQRVGRCKATTVLKRQNAGPDDRLEAWCRTAMPALQTSAHSSTITHSQASRYPLAGTEDDNIFGQEYQDFLSKSCSGLSKDPRLFC